MSDRLLNIPLATILDLIALFVSVKVVAAESCTELINKAHNIH